jgi:hypothetical protein
MFSQAKEIGVCYSVRTYTTSYHLKLKVMRPYSVVFLANQSIAWGLTWYGKYLLSRALHPIGDTEMHQMIPFLPILFRDSNIVLAVVARECRSLHAIASLI